MALNRLWILGASIILTTTAHGDDDWIHRPVNLSIQPEAESVYAPPQPPREDQGINEGAVHIDLSIRTMTDYVFRGLDRSDGTGLALPVKPGQLPVRQAFGHEDSPNYQVDTKLSFDLGKLPHPYLGIFVNLYNSDPISRFQEVRPFFGFEWTIKPIVLEAGVQTFIFPEREDINTSEVYARITFDDRRLFKTEQPILSPYVFGAFDYDLYDGWYFEAGVKHDFIFEDWGLTISPVFDVAFVLDNAQYTAVGREDTGFQHLDVGLLTKYSLNQLLNIPKRYGEFSLDGYIYYTDKLSDDLLADRQIWGGLGVGFKY